MPEYKGKCDDQMIHRILTENMKDLKEHERDALRELRIGINKIVQGIDDIEVTIYLDNIEPVVITNGSGGNKLVMTIKKSGEVSYDWKQKTVWQKGKEYVQSIVTKLLNKIEDILLEALVAWGAKAIVGAGHKAITWVTQ